MTLVGYDEVEFLDGNGGVVNDVTGVCAAEGLRQLGAGEIVCSLGKLLAPQDGVEPLDRADGDARHRVDMRGRQMLDVVQLSEESPRVGRAVPRELITRLFAEVRPIDEKENALRPGVFDEAIDERAGRECLSRAGGHVDQRARPG